MLKKNIYRKKETQLKNMPIPNCYEDVDRALVTVNKFCHGHDIFGRGVNRGGDRCSLQKAEEESELRSGGGCDSESSNFM